MADYVTGIKVTLDDQASQGAQAATDRLSKLADAADKATTSTDTLNTTTARSGPSFDTINRKIDEAANLTAALDRANRAFTQGLAAVKAQVDAGNLSTDQAAEKERRLQIIRDTATQTATKQSQALAQQFGAQTKASDQLTASTGNQAFAQRQLGVQLTQFLSSVQGGQPVFTALIQQGHQLGDVLESTGVGFSGLGKAATGLFNAVGGLPVLIGVAVAGALVAVTVAAENANQRLKDTQNILRATQSDYQALAGAVNVAAGQFAAKNPVSFSEAIEGTRNLAASVNTAYSGLQKLQQLTLDVAAVENTTFSAASQRIVADMADVGKAALDAAQKGFPEFNAQLVLAIKSAHDSGDELKAQTLFIDTMREHYKNGAKDGVTPLSDAMHNLSIAFTSSKDGGASFIEKMGKPFNDGLTAVVNSVASVVSWLDKLGEKYPQTLKLIADALHATGLDKILLVTALGPVVGSAAVLGLSTGTTTSPNATSLNTPPAGLDPLAARAIYTGATQLGVSDQIANLAANMAKLVESNGQQFNDQGGTLLGPVTRYGQAMGLMQVMPDVKGGSTATIGGQTYDLTDLAQNAKAGVARLAEFVAQFGSIEKGAWAYSAGPANVQAGIFPDETARNFQKLGLNPPVIGANARTGTAQYGPPTPEDAARNTQLQSSVLTGADPLGIQKNQDLIDKLNESIKTSRGNLDTAFAAGDDSGITREIKNLANLHDQLTAAEEASKHLGTAQQQAARESDIQTKALSEQNPVLRELAQIESQQREAASKAGQTYDPSATTALQTNKLKELSTAFYDNVQAINRQTDSEKARLSAMERGTIADQLAANAEKAKEDAYSHFQPNSDAAIAGIKAETDALNRLTLVKVDAVARQDNSKLTEENQLVVAQTNAIGDSVRTRNEEIAVLQERIKLGIPLDGSLDSSFEKTMALVRANADLKTNFQQVSSSVSELTNSLSQAFDQLGSALVNSFVSGSGAAINFGNVLKGVVSSVLTTIVKLAVVNPIINSLLGTSNPTLGLALQGLAGTAGSNGSVINGSAPGSSSLSQLSSIVSIGSNSSVLNALGITGPGGLSESLGLTGGSGTGFLSSAGSAVTGFLATPVPLIGTAAVPVGGAGFGAYGAVASDSAIVGGSASSGSAAVAATGTIGQFAGGIGLGYAAGSLVGGYLAGDSPQRQTTAQVGAAVGAVAGAVIGTVVPVIGTVIGGLIGGLLGGGGGGLFGPGKENTYSGIPLSIENGQLALGPQISQKDRNAASELSDTQSKTQTLNAFLSANNLQITSLGVARQIGINTPGGFQDPSKFNSLSDALPQLRFGAAGNSGNSQLDTALNNSLKDTSFTNSDDLNAAVQLAQNFVNVILPSLTKDFTSTIGVTGTFNDNLKKVNDTYNAAIVTAQKLGVGEADLTTARDRAVKQLTDEAKKNLDITNQQLGNRYNSALASLTNDARLANQVNLDNFDTAAQQQRDAFTQNLVSTYGDAYKSTQEYADEIANLEKTLGEERLAIVKQNNQAAISATTSAISNLSQYVYSLQTGSNTPLSPTDQYSLAKSQFNTVADKAKSGDFGSINLLQTDANTLLAASRAVNGSGFNYVQDFQKVLDALDQVSTSSPDALTASFYAAQVSAQTDSIVTSLSALKDEVTAVKLAITQSTSAPARIAA